MKRNALGHLRFASNAWTWTHCPKRLNNDFSLFQSIFGREDIFDRPECIKIEQSREDNRDEHAKIQDGGRQNVLDFSLLICWSDSFYLRSARQSCDTLIARELFNVFRVVPVLSDNI